MWILAFIFSQCILNGRSLIYANELQVYLKLSNRQERAANRLKAYLCAGFGE